jgi:hypothetical protein
MFKTRTVPSLPPKVSGCVADWPASGLVHVTVQVKTPGHVPQGVVLRTRIDAVLFTGAMEASCLQQVAADPLLVSLAAASRVLPAGPEGPEGQSVPSLLARPEGAGQKAPPAKRQRKPARTDKAAKVNR